MPGFERTSRNLNDWLAFEVGARTLVHYQDMKIWSTPALHLYVDNSQLQIGPPPILLITPFERFSPHAVALGFGLVMCALGVASLAALEACAKTVATRHLHARIAAVSFIVGVVVVAVWCHEMGIWRHLDDAMALTSISIGLWLCARRGPWWAIALVLGTGVASKPWAVVAVPFLLGLPRPLWGKTVLLLLATAAAWWSPFVIAAPGTIHALGSYRTYPSPGSILNLVGVNGDVSNWLRPVQFAAGLAVASHVAAGGRWIAAPLGGLAARVALDPFAYPYYGLGPLLAAVVVDLTSNRRVPRWTAFTLLVEFCLPVFASPPAAAIGRLVWCGAVAVWCIRGIGNRQMAETGCAACLKNHDRLVLRIAQLLPQVAGFGYRNKPCHRAEGQEKSTPVARRGRKARGLEGPRVRPAASAGTSPGGPRTGKLATPACYSSEGSE